MEAMKPKIVFLCLALMGCMPSTGYADTLQEAIDEALIVPFAILEAADVGAHCPTVFRKENIKSVGVLRSVHPIYPRTAKKCGWEGTVLVRVTVETNGRASKAAVSRSSGHKVLDDAAVKAVKRWSFRPARDWNIPIRSEVVIPVCVQ